MNGWVSLGMFLPWQEVRKPTDPYIPVVVSPLGVEPKKPRALWDGTYVNEFCRDLPFVMDNAAKVAEVAWTDLYFFKVDHKNGYQHVPIHVAGRNQNKSAISYADMEQLVGKLVSLECAVTAGMWYVRDNIQYVRE